jgi:class 3 adenylate cyclase/tetratricopeptide (TPR) repeat protein
VKCSICEQDNPTATKFCLGCGARLGLECGACGAKLPSAARFCIECGAKVAAHDAPVARFAAPDAYTPKFLAEKILTSRTSVEGERKHVTVLFADIRGSLELLDGRDPEEARGLLDPALHTMMQAVHQYEGTVNQVLGDGVMALFGAPLAHEDHALRACYAALRMQEQIRLYADEVRCRDGLNLQIRVGLNSGEVVVRAIGNDLSMEYSAVGETTHLAARMEQLASPGSVLATQAVTRLAGDYLQLNALGPVPVRGRSEPVEIFEIVGTTSTRTRLQAAVAKGLTPFVGRETELQTLGGLLDRAHDGSGQVAALVGEPGVGKSRLCWELSHLPQSKGYLVLEGDSVSYAKSSAYHPVVELLRAYFQIDESDSGRKRREKIVARLLALDESLMGILPYLLSLMEGQSDEFAAGMDPQQRAWRTQDALKRLLLRQSQQQPLLLIFENLHWIDGESQLFLDTLVESVPTAAIVVLVTYRPEYQHGWASKSHYTQLLLGALPPASASALVRGVLAEQPGVDELARLLVERTGGNPLFLEESIKTLVETRALVGEQRAWRLAKPLSAIEVPPTVQAVLAARIDRHAPEEKRLLQSAAVIGKHAPLSLLQAVADSSEQALRASIARLQAAEFLYETTLFPEPQYTFKHNLTYEVAYASLLHERRRALHARIVQAVEALPEESRAERVEFLAHHAFQGQLWPKAVRYLRQAGARALTRAANREAIAHFQSALEALRRLPESRETLTQAIDLRFDLVVPNLRLGQLPQIVALLGEAESLSDKLADEQRLARAFSHLVNYYYLTGEPGKAIQYGERCQAIGHALRDPSLQELARRYMGHSYHAQGEYRQAESVLRENLHVLGAASAGWVESDRLSEVASAAWIAFAMADLGDFAAAQAFAERALQTAEESSDAYTKAIASTMAGLVWLRRGFPGRAVPHLQRSVQGCKDAHLPLWQPVASSLLGLALVMLDALDEALPLLEDAVERTGELGIKAYLALWQTHLAEGLLAAGRIERARALAEQALQLAIAHHERGHQAWALKVCGDVAAQQGEAGREAARAYYADALSLARQLGARPLGALTHLGMGRLFRRSGLRESAEEQLAEALALCVDLGLGVWVERAAGELKQLGQTWIVSSDQDAFYERLRHSLAGNGTVEVILDRRQEQQNADWRAAEQWAGPERRRMLARASALQAHGLAVVQQESAAPVSA